ncbi:MAG: hypothetical protein WC443_08125 [Desulfobaccales bacterium]
MKKTKWMTVGIVVALTVVMLWAAPGLAQMRGRGQGGQGWGCGQGQGSGPGAASGTCPAINQGYQDGQGNRVTNRQTNMERRGQRGPGRNFQQPNTQPQAPPVTQ